MVKTIEWRDGKVIMLDQSRLPCEVTYIECTAYTTVAEGIRKLWIRGAPAIGIAAAMGIALGARDIRADDFGEFIKKLEDIQRQAVEQMQKEKKPEELKYIG